MKKETGYNASTQTNMNIAWFLPRPHPSHYKGGMPLHCERWLLALAQDILNNPNATILNLFCGMNQQGLRIDLNPEVQPDILGDAHRLSELVADTFDIILADPPYSDEETKLLYSDKFPHLNYNKWTSECTKVLNPKGLLIVYHKYIMPNPEPGIYKVVKRVFLGHRTYHVPRVATYFQKQ